ncbi:MAG: glycosyltransferase family 2 protein [Acidobacteria bacterium]|nr:glycosyltransferase family 2 protein [Acidobacteriota bacterium]
MSEKISIIVPIYNERENLELFLTTLMQTLEPSGEEFEILLIDDGSTDGSDACIARLSAQYPHIRVIQFRRNFGQTAAMAAGFDYAGGSILIPMDADLQNDPRDIPAILAKLREGYDVVSCWRKSRQDAWLTRRLPSQIANLLISFISGVRLHDYGCTLKGYRREVVEHIRLYGEMHRFIPVYASWAGAKVAEIPVRHHPRISGSSKYGLGRTFKVILDLITVKLLGSYSTKPMYFFGGVGLMACGAGSLFALLTLYDKYFNNVKAHNNPLLLLAVFLFLLGVQFVLMGLVAELVIRTYFESQGKTPYIVRQIWNGDRKVDAKAVQHGKPEQK